MKEDNNDLLGKLDHYWKMIPTHHTPSYSVENTVGDISSIQILTLSKNDKNWKMIFECPHLEELNLVQPSLDQIKALDKLIGLKRLRIKSFRAKDVEFIRSLEHLEELSLEYGSGFSDLSPLQSLSKLKSLHLENLRKVSDFNGLQGIESLKYLHISGTLDWKQPIENLSFLEDLHELEVFSLWIFALKASFPAFISVLKLKKLLEIRIPIGMLDTAEYAFLEVAKPEAIKGFGDETSWPLYINTDYTDQGYLSLLGKGEGRIKVNHPDANTQLQAYLKKYKEYKQSAQDIISMY
ncbi:leucine-rich repeat domain-containing protein [Chryseobacterium sp. JK1]|uniref:leucine-rich repeat domain-containing protein n=1 Tax=Chryseobacterium sp. JK1 TaxID=874294 RepID=UPI003D68A81E